MKLLRKSGELIGEGETLAEIVAANKADLSVANLSGANLRVANLRWADLSVANLSGANLSVANLSGANLSWANLSWANLSGANLSGASLRWANLSWANLSGANLSGASLSGANLSGANLRGTGCVCMQCGPWAVWVTPERCSIGCQDHLHEFWQAATPGSVAHMHEHAEKFWRMWGEMILAACRACAKHGWPKAKE